MVIVFNFLSEHKDNYYLNNNSNNNKDLKGLLWVQIKIRQNINIIDRHMSFFIRE